MDNQSNGAERAARAAAGAANIARGAAYGGLYGAAAEAVKSFFPEIVKGSVILLFVIILGPLLVFTALPNIMFGFDSATAPDIVDFTASAHELEAIYQNIDQKNQSIIDRLVESILPDFMTDDTPDYAKRLREQGRKIICIVPEKGHEYRPLCKAMGGQFIKLGPSSPDCIGLMEIRRFSAGAYGGQARRDSLLAEKVSWLSVWYSLQKRGLTEEDRSYIDSSLIECYGCFGITFDNASLFEEDGKTLKEMPVVRDWYDLLMERTETRHLAVVLTRYVSGSAASMGGRTNVDTDNPYTVIDLTGLSDDLQLAAVYAATGFATDVIVQNGDVGTALLSDELWKLLGANSNPLAADYTMQMVKLIRSQGGIAGVTSQGMADMMALDGGKYGKGILDSCRVKFIMQMEEQEARLVQEKLALTEEETRMITRFRRGEGLLCIGHNHVPIAIHVSPKEYEAITTSPTDLRARLRQKG